MEGGTEPRTRRQSLGVALTILMTSGFAAALITGGIGLLGERSSEDEERCRLALEFLADDAKDERVLTDDVLDDVREVVISMIRTNCAEGE